MTRRMTSVLSEVRPATSPGPVRSRAGLVTELLELMRDPASSVARLGTIVSSDQALSERVLRIANSPALGIPSRVETVSRAVTLLGFDALRETIMRMVVTGAFRTIVALFTQYEEFWKHSIACGLAARLLARKQPEGQPDDAFVAGLFHDIGMIAPSGTGEGQLRWKGVPGDVQDPVADHQETGAWWAEQWGMNERIVEAIRCHHCPGKAVRDPRLAATVHVADILCRRLEVGKYAADPDQECDPTALEILGLTEAELSAGHLQDDAQSIEAGMAEAPSFARMVASLKNALVEAIGGLPYQERLALALCYQEGLAPGEVAHLMGITEEDVQHLHDVALSTLATTIHDVV
ncbi:MAG: HDOD domain-containing protein [Bacteroidetes bacterium]|nr:HDOD domain-containing protein [Bacteroidota bacterium]